MKTSLLQIEEKVINECLLNLPDIFPNVSNDFTEVVESTWEFVNQLGIKMLEAYFNDILKKINEHPFANRIGVSNEKTTKGFFLPLWVM